MHVEFKYGKYLTGWVRYDRFIPHFIPVRYVFVPSLGHYFITCS